MKSSKFQPPSTRETPNTKNKMPGSNITTEYPASAWSFKLGASLDVGAWDLELL
jgi:hypothetical protein